MSIITSYSVGDGDMFTIRHGGQTYTIIDCCYSDKNHFKRTIQNIMNDSMGRKIQFISTHPDEDHIKGIGFLFSNLRIDDFYVVRNRAVKENPSVNFENYKKLRDGRTSARIFPIVKGKTAASGISFLWPDVDNDDFKRALHKANNGEEFNNISPIIMYSLDNGAKVMWMGDIATAFLEEVMHDIEWKKIDVLFAPHHGRKSGKVPKYVMDRLNPDLVVIGESNSEYLDYYQGYDTVTQNRAGDIRLECLEGEVLIYCADKDYDPKFKHIAPIWNKYKTGRGWLKGELSV